MLKLEKFKTIVLSFLVLISIILTTRIWLDISIEGIFIMPQNNEAARIDKVSNQFDIMSLIKPEKLILNDNGKHTLLFNDTEIGSIYDRIISDANNMLKFVLGSKESIQYEKHTLEYLDKLRLERNVEIDFPFSYDTKLLASILGVNKREWEDIKSIDSILVAFDSNVFYIVDKSGNSIHEFDSIGLKSGIRFMVDMLNSSDQYSYIFLSGVDKKKYGENVLIPIYTSPYKLPKLSAVSEIEHNGAEEIAANFFDIDMSLSRSFVDPSGTIIYTDGVDRGVKIDKSGLIEYVSYSYETKAQKLGLALEDFVRIATDFINNHLGFPKDTFISSIESVIKDEKLESCIIKYDYRYEGIPIINDNLEMENPIEIEIVGGQIKRFKRLIRDVRKTDEIRDVKTPLDIIDIIYKRLCEDKNVCADDILINDIYLSYFEYGYGSNISMIPVWVVHVEAGQEKDGKYIMNAESGVILSEPY